MLDEIGNMPLLLQTRLLRVLEDKTVMPLGGGRAAPVDFQRVCATHCDLAALAEPDTEIGIELLPRESSPPQRPRRWPM